MSGIPYLTSYTTVNTVRDLDLSTLPAINFSIDVVSDQMIDQGWTRVGLYASTTMTLDLPLIGTDAIFNFALWIISFEGHAFEAFNTTLMERDPTGDVTGGWPVIGIGVASQGGLTDSAYQTMLVAALIAAMNGSQANWIVSGINVGGSFSTYQQLLITATHPGPAWNDVYMEANANGSGSFNGLPKGGGWLFTSVPTPGEGSTMSVSFENSNHGNFTATVNFNVLGETLFHHSPARYLLNFKEAYWSVVMPHQWMLFHLNDGVPYTGRSSEEIFSGGDSLWICNPRVEDSQINDPTIPIYYCGFMWQSDFQSVRGTLYEGLSLSTCINSTFTEGAFSAFELDAGIAFFVLNSMYHAAGALLTTAEKSIRIASTVGLSTAINGPLQIIGDVWGMYLDSKYWPIDTLSITTDGSHQIIAYRSQQGPCEWTLWLAIS